MNLEFDLNNITLTEFGVGRDDETDKTFVLIPVDTGVQGALKEMANTTYAKMQEISNVTDSTLYEPSEKYSSTEYLYLPINDELAATIRELHEAQNLDIDTKALSDPQNIFCYFVRFKDNKGKRLTSFHRAAQFKGILKNRLVHLLNDSLKIVDDNVFKLDNDFDFFVDSKNIYILRPSSFEFAGKLQGAILAAVSKNINTIKRELSFVEFNPISEYASTHPRAARYLASILKQEGLKDIGKNELITQCNNTGVDVSELKGKLIISVGHEMGFLEVLDRRRYDIELIRGQPEKFKAASRRQL